MKVILKKLLGIFAFCLFLELFIFNFKYFESHFFEKTADYNIIKGFGLEEISSGTYIINDPANAYFEITELNVNVKNVYINYISEDDNMQKGKVLSVVIYATDAGNSLYFSLPETKVVSGIEESKYIRLHLNGQSKNIRININKNVGDIVNISEIGINHIRALTIHPIRIIFLFIVLVLYFMFRSKSKLYANELDYNNWRQKIVIYFIITLHVCLFVFIGLSPRPADYYKVDTWVAHNEYEYLADALINGHTYIDEEPPQYLAEMENPYDDGLRQQNQAETGEYFLVDFAYWNGHYYCYFGIVPALIFFVPFKLLTGVSLQTWIPVVICSVLYCISSFFFIYQLVRKYYPKTSIGIYLVLSSVFIAGSEILYLAHFANVYSMPIMLGLLLGVTGLGFWIKASISESMPKRYICLGAICIALVAGCRPQLEIILIFAFPIFWSQLKAKKFFSIKGMGNTLSMLLPFIIIGIGLMYYNYARFGSPFDFGANYNLTSNDMTHRGINLYRNFLGIYEYAFQPLNIKSTFPFMETIQLNTEYQGFTSSEPLLGGYFCMNIIALFSLGLFKCKNSLKEHGAFVITGMSFWSAVIIILLTIQMSGLTQRYMSDFGWLFMIPAIFVILDLKERFSQYECFYMIFTKIVIVLSVMCIVTNYFSLFANGRYADLINMNPSLFYLVKFMFFRC